MKYLVVDAELNGTGIRDYYEGCYLNPEDLNISFEVIQQLNGWLIKYEKEHYSGFKNDKLINELDRIGKEIALKIKNELPEVKMEYFSEARMIKEII